MSDFLLFVLAEIRTCPGVSVLALTLMTQQELRSHDPTHLHVCVLSVTRELKREYTRPIALEFAETIIRKGFYACVGTMDPDHPPPLRYFTAVDRLTHIGLSIVEDNHAYLSIGCLGLVTK